jgi:hypothetical protein
MIYRARKAIARARRFVNDSSIGTFVNDSIPGILVEGASRGMGDAIEGAEYSRVARLATVGKPTLGKTLTAIAYIATAAMTNHFEEGDPQLHYSHTSPLWKRLQNTTEGTPKYDIMQRVRVTDALENRCERTVEAIAEIVPRQLLIPLVVTLAIGTSRYRPEEPYIRQRISQLDETGISPMSEVSDGSQPNVTYGALALNRPLTQSPLARPEDRDDYLPFLITPEA